jgi:hypothetical protein
MISSPNISRKCSSERSPASAGQGASLVSPDRVDGRAAQQNQIMEIHLSLNQYFPGGEQLFFPKVW